MAVEAVTSSLLWRVCAERGHWQAGGKREREESGEIIPLQRTLQKDTNTRRDRHWQASKESKSADESIDHGLRVTVDQPRSPLIHGQRSAEWRARAEEDKRMPASSTAPRHGESKINAN